MQIADTIDRQQDPMLINPPEEPLDLSPYEGRWVAILRGQVCAVGETAVQALSYAKFQRPKDEPEIVWVPKQKNVTSH